MEHIVQLSDTEYERLVEMANLNEKKINARAVKLWKNKGACEIRVQIRCKDDYADSFTIDCEADTLIKDGKFSMSEKLRRKIEEFTKSEVEYAIGYTYGEAIKIINRYGKEMKALAYVRFVLYGISVAGWAAFLMCLLLK